MRHALLALALLTTAPALADAGPATVPEQGTFGVGAALSGEPATGAVQMTTGLNGSFWLLDQLKLEARFNLFASDGVGSRYGLGGGFAYYLVKNRKESYGLFVGADAGVAVEAPDIGDSNTRFALQLKGGGEYFVSRHFSVQLAEIAGYTSSPSTYAFATEIGLNWYF